MVKTFCDRCGDEIAADTRVASFNLVEQPHPNVDARTWKVAVSVLADLCVPCVRVVVKAGAPLSPLPLRTEGR